MWGGVGWGGVGWGGVGWCVGWGGGVYVWACVGVWGGGVSGWLWVGLWQQVVQAAPRLGETRGSGGRGAREGCQRRVAMAVGPAAEGAGCSLSPSLPIAPSHHVALLLVNPCQTTTAWPSLYCSAC